MEIFSDMFVYENVFKNDEEIRLFVEAAEKNYKDQVLEIATKVASMDNVKFLTL